MCCYVSGMFIWERSCFSMVALVVYVASYSHSATQVLAVTITFVVAANIMTLKLFNPSMGCSVYVTSHLKCLEHGRTPACFSKFSITTHGQ